MQANHWELKTHLYRLHMIEMYKMSGVHTEYLQPNNACFYLDMNSFIDNFITGYYIEYLYSMSYAVIFWGFVLLFSAKSESLM